jgi:hypothetical protein
MALTPDANAVSSNSLERQPPISYRFESDKTRTGCPSPPENRGPLAVGKIAVPSAVVYVLPLVLYLGMTMFLPRSPDLYPWLYVAGVVLVGAGTLALLWGRQVLRPHGDVWAGVLVGLVGIAIWIPLSLAQREYHLTLDWLEGLWQKGRPGFDPYTEISQPLARWSFIAVRLLGLAVLVPVVEELFWRGFLLRWLIAPDWERQPLGQFTPLSFLGVTLLFPLIHPQSEALAALLYAALLNGLIYWKRDLWNCVVAHAVSNLVLGIYVLATKTWALW